jgi:hypothetical protein
MYIHCLRAGRSCRAGKTVLHLHLEGTHNKRLCAQIRGALLLISYWGKRERPLVKKADGRRARREEFRRAEVTAVAAEEATAAEGDIETVASTNTLRGLANEENP